MTRSARKADDIRRIDRTVEERAYFEISFARFSVAHLLQEMRAAAGFTQKELASRAGMSQPEVSRLESGGGTQAPTLQTLLRFAKVCGFHLDLTTTPVRPGKGRVRKTTALNPRRR